MFPTNSRVVVRLLHYCVDAAAKAGQPDSFIVVL
jgi:hypothetical protein